MCVSLGWRAAYYVCGGVTLLFFIAWLIIYGDDPQTHRVRVR